MIKIFIADHHKIIREGLKMILKAETDLTVVAEAITVHELQQKIPTHTCDILLLDMDMPERKGLELICEIKRNQPKLPILALSMVCDDKQALRLLRSGASGFVCKDSVYEELVKAIRRIHTHGRYLSERLREQLAISIASEDQVKPHEQLSNRELETMFLLAAGKKVKEIAEELTLSVSTIFTFRARIFEKLDIKTNAELMHYALKNNLIDLNKVYS